jgi:hypothetical protein
VSLGSSRLPVSRLEPLGERAGMSEFSGTVAIWVALVCVLAVLGAWRAG